MEFWIRSQDKEILLKANDISISNNVINEGESIKFKGYKIVGYFDKNTEYEHLGSYATKERALEVLDDIQNFICTEIHENNIDYEEADLILKAKIVDSLCKVYQMPED